MTIERWVCKKCKETWIYPIEKCIFCRGPITQEFGKKMKVVGITKVFIPSPMHPIIPYNILVLEDEHGSRMPRKTMKDFKIGDYFEEKASGEEHAVSLVRVKYDVNEAVKGALGLIEFKIDKKAKIMLKPNIMVASYPYLGMTTHPKVVEGVIKFLLDSGFKKENIIVAEQCQYGDMEDALQKSGIGEVLEQYSIKFVDLGKSRYVSKVVAQFNFEIAEEVFKQDLIINIPVMKTHLMLGISGALENATRLISAKNYKELQTKPEVLEAVAALHQVLPKYVTVGDAIIGMQGNGPLQHGEPLFLNMVFASRDAVAHDKVFQELGLLRKAEHVETAGRMGVGKNKIEEIEIVGYELEAAKREIMPAIGSKLIKM